MTPLYKYLGYAGALPFLFCALGMLLFHGTLSVSFTTIQIVYAGLILSFMGGIHWAHAFPRNSEGQMLIATGLSLLSFALILLALFSLYSGWLGLTLQTIVMSFCLLCYIGGFLFLYATDLQSLDQEDLPEDYMDFRLKITILVCVALGVSLMAIWM